MLSFKKWQTLRESVFGSEGESEEDYHRLLSNLIRLVKTETEKEAGSSSRKAPKTVLPPPPVGTKTTPAYTRSISQFLAARGK